MGNARGVSTELPAMRGSNTSKIYRYHKLVGKQAWTVRYRCSPHLIALGVADGVVAEQGLETGIQCVSVDLLIYFG
jgi:hypothetical protein